MNIRTPFILTFIAGVGIGAIATRVGADMLGSSVFPDVPAGAYYDAPIGRLYGQGVIKGAGDGRFHPGDFVTRADVAVMIDRAINGDVQPVPPPPLSSSSRSSRSTSSSSSVSSSSSSSSSAASVGAAGAFRFAVEKVSISEASPNVSISIIRYGGKSGNVMVKWTTGDGTAKASEDFNQASGTITMADGETQKLISLNFINDLIPEPNETFTLTLSDPTGGSVIGSPSVATVTILDNDGGGGNSTGSSASSTPTGSSTATNAVGFNAFAYSIHENSGTMTVTVNRKGSTSSEAKVEYATTDGSAKAGTDYVASQGTLTFATGETSKTFTVTVNDTTGIEGNRSFNVTLKNPTGVSLGNPISAPVTIVDNEATPSGSGSFMMAADTYTVLEKDASVTVTVYRRTGFGGTSTVKYATSDSTATGNSDYTIASGTLTFLPHESSKTVTIAIIKDTNTENEERFNFTLSEPSNAVLGSVYSSVVKISD